MKERVFVKRYIRQTSQALGCYRVSKVISETGKIGGGLTKEIARRGTHPAVESVK